MITRRTEFTAFILDLMNFMEEKVREALDDEENRAAAVAEAAGAIPVLRDRLRESEVVQANFILVLDAVFEAAVRFRMVGGLRDDGPRRI